MKNIYEWRDVEDDVTFEILMIKDIRDEAEYSGYRVTINGKFDTIYQKFKIDIMIFTNKKIIKI